MGFSLNYKTIFDADFRNPENRTAELAKFDMPEDESRRRFEEYCTHDYYFGYYGIEDHNEFIRLKAGYDVVNNRDYATQLKTKESFSFKIPYEIRVTARWKEVRHALYCPAWTMPVEDNGGDFVFEQDVVESTRKGHVVFSTHKGTTGYDNHEAYSRPKKMNPGKWRTYRMIVTENGVVWYTRRWFFWKKRFWMDYPMPDAEQFLWVSIIMHSNRHNELPEGEPEMDISRITIYK